MTLAPIVIFTYKRENKTRMLLDSLCKDSLASSSEVYVFSDGSKAGDEHEVQRVRILLNEYKEKNVFKSFNVFFREKNYGLANSIISGVTDIINRFGKVIVLEDDLIVQGGFLKYMNGALQYYEQNSMIWSISGYTPKLKALKTYKPDVYLGYRASSWGWATWKDRWNLIDWNISDYSQFKRNPKRILKFFRGGNDLPSMLRAQINGKINSWAVRWCYNQSKLDKFTVFPKQSRIRNFGFDVDGTHTLNKVECEKFFVDEIQSEIDCIFEDIILDKKLVKQFYKLNKLSIYTRIRDKIKEVLSKF